MKKFGIDISVWQKGINLVQAKNEGVEFTILRGMYGNAKDTEFENFYTEAKKAGLGVGVYQWGRACNIAQAREEAQILIDSCLKGKQFDYPIYYDVEDSILLKLGIQELTEVIKAWATTLENAGYLIGVYMNQSCFDTEINGSELTTKYTQWRAKWTTEDKKPDSVGMWQFGGEINLIRSNKIAGYICDQNFCYVDFPSIIINRGFNGYKNLNIEIYKKDIETVAKEVIEGIWGNGEIRKINLENAGYNYNEIQNRVNELMQVNKIEYYIIKKGDNLTRISKQFNTTVNQIVSWNNIKNPNLIYAGQKIRVK